jgi:hypothetical protein
MSLAAAGLMVATLYGPVAAADRSPSASPMPVASPALLPPPPAYFDPGTIPYVGSRFGVPGELGDLWFGRLDGSGMRAVPVRNSGIGQAVAGNSIVVTARGPAGSAGNRLVLVRADGSTVDLLTDQKGLFAVSYAGDAVYTFRADGRTTESVSGLWRVPIDGTKPRRVLPRAPGGSHVAVSPDERSFAMGWKIGDQPLKITARFDLGPARRPVSGLPQGFDAAGRLIFDGSRFDPESGTIRGLKGMGRANGQIVTSDGRTMLALVGSEIRALDLVTGSRRSWDLAPGDWFLTELSTGRYAVAARFTDDPDYEVVETFAVVDLFEGWLGYVPFTVPS